jgi:hypothetical protein
MREVRVVSLSSSAERSKREVENPKTQPPYPHYSHLMELAVIIIGTVALWCAALWLSQAIF